MGVPSKARISGVWTLRKGSLSESDSNNPQQRILREVLFSVGEGRFCGKFVSEETFIVGGGGDGYWQKLAFLKSSSPRES